MRKWLGPGLLVWWGLLLCVPTCRENLLALISSKGPALDDQTRGGFYDLPQVIAGCTEAVTEPCPDRDTERFFLTDLANRKELLQKYPKDVEALAWWLSVNSASNFSGFESMDPSSPEVGFARVLQVARLGQSRDPGNAFFPLMAAEIEMSGPENGVAEDRVATLKDLRLASQCSRFDDYSANYQRELYLRARERGPLEMGQVDSLLWATPEVHQESTTGSRLVATIPVAVKEFLTEFQPGGDDPASRDYFAMAALLIKVGMLQRTTAKTPESRFLGALLEYGTLSPDCLFRKQLSTYPFSSSEAIHGDRLPLVLAARHYGRTDVANLATSQWDLARNHWRDFCGDQVTDPLTDIYGVYEAGHIQRLLLWSFPLCLLLLLASAGIRLVGSVLTTFQDGRWVAKAMWSGMFYGLLGFAVLISGDVVVALRSSLWGTDSFAKDGTFWGAPGLPAAMPSLALCGMGLGLLGRAIALGTPRRRSKPGEHEFQDQRELGALVAGAHFAKTCRRLAAISIGLIPLLLFALGCWTVFRPIPSGDGLTSPNWGCNDQVPLWSSGIIALITLGLMARWGAAHFSDWRFGVASTSVCLRPLLMGYLLVATALFSQQELVRIADTRNSNSALSRELNPK